MLNIHDFFKKEKTIAVIGLGYVGLPLAVALARHFTVIGFDISQKRVDELSKGIDHTNEVAHNDLVETTLILSANPSDLEQASILIIAVPTPIDSHKRPDLTPVEKASSLVAKHLSKDAIIVYESTVYPGVTEEICVPLLEKGSGKKFGRDFTVGYSPERINPGDKVHTVDKIIKVVSGSTEETANLLADIYGAVITAGIHKAPSIKVAEAAKVIENTQRDLNIALMNELALIFDRLGIDTLDVLEAAGTKWNFLPFRPGLVGGHCIGVDPYYLTYKAEEIGYHPQVILAGRRINDNMGKFIAEKTVKMLISTGSRVGDARVGILGLTFKENVPDLRNTRVVDIQHELEEYGITVCIHDPLADPTEAKEEYGLELTSLESMQNMDILIVAVAHDVFKEISLETLRSYFHDKEKAILLDLKGLWTSEEVASAGLTHWRL